MQQIAQKPIEFNIRLIHLPGFLLLLNQLQIFSKLIKWSIIKIHISVPFKSKPGPQEHPPPSPPQPLPWYLLPDLPWYSRQAPDITAGANGSPDASLQRQSHPFSAPGGASQHPNVQPWVGILGGPVWLCTHCTCSSPVSPEYNSELVHCSITSLLHPLARSLTNSLCLPAAFPVTQDLSLQKSQWNYPRVQ